MPDPPKAARLPLSFDPAGLQADLAMLGTDEWIAHFNTWYYAGDWSGVALRSVAGSNNPMYGDASHHDFADTQRLQQCRHLRAVVEAFECPLRSVRLLRLTAGSVILEHRDFDLGYELGEVRIHVPISTNPGVEFYLENRRIVMREGECWYLDLNLSHRVQNLGSSERVHLVIDCQLNEWLRAIIASGTPSEGTESGYEPFRRRVLDDAGLQEELASLTDRSAFVARTVELGRQNGFQFEPGDVDGAMQAARRTWMERWIV